MTKSSLFCPYNNSMSLIYIYPQFFSDPSTTLHCAESELSRSIEKHVSNTSTYLHKCPFYVSIFCHFINRFNKRPKYFLL